MGRRPSRAASRVVQHSPRITRSFSRRPAEVASLAVADGQDSGGDAVDQSNGRPATAQRPCNLNSAPISSVAQVVSVSDSLSSLSLSSSTSTTAATVVVHTADTVADDIEDEQDLRPISSLLPGLTHAVSLIPSSLPFTASCNPSSPPIPSSPLPSASDLFPHTLIPTPLLPPTDPTSPLPDGPLPSSLPTHVPAPPASLPIPPPPPAPLVGPQRVLEPACIDAPSGGGAGTGPTSPTTGNVRGGNAANAGHGRQGEDREAGIGGGNGASENDDSDVVITSAVIHSAPPAPARCLPLDELAGLPHTPHALRTIGEGRCSVASVMLAMGKLPVTHFTDTYRKSIDTMRITLGMRLKTQWTAERWVREVPKVWRMGDKARCTSDANLPHLQTSYTECWTLLTDPRKACQMAGARHLLCGSGPVRRRYFPHPVAPDAW